MMTGNVKQVPDSHIHEFIKTTGEIAKYPEDIYAERGDALHQEYIDRHEELRQELRDRKASGVLADTPSPKPASSDGTPEPSETLVKDGEKIPSNDTNVPTIDQTNPSSHDKIKGDFEESSSKRKYESDDESNSQPHKIFKQNSSDITGDTEPFDFGGGDD